MYSLARTAIAIFLVAVAVNYPWELAQAPLFRWPSQGQGVWWHCFFAALGDGFITLLIFAAGWAAQRRQDWFAQPGTSGYVVMLITGLVIAAVVEWVAVHLLWRWSYSALMPLVPLLDIGIVSLAQMLVLPPLIFRAAGTWLYRRSK